MNKPTKPNIIIPEAFAVDGVKNDFTAEKLQNGFDRIQPDVFWGDNLNKLIDDTYKGLNYSMAAADAINLINEGELLESLKTYNIIDDSYSNMYFDKDIKELQSEEEVSLILESEQSNSKKDFLITIEKHESRNKSFLEKIKNFFDRLFSDISSFFKRLFHL